MGWPWAVSCNSAEPRRKKVRSTEREAWRKGRFAPCSVLPAPRLKVPPGSRHLWILAAERLDIRPGRQVIIDDLAARGKACDSKLNRRKCNPNMECRRSARAENGPGSPEHDLPTEVRLKRIRGLRRPVRHCRNRPLKPTRDYSTSNCRIAKSRQQSSANTGRAGGRGENSGLRVELADKTKAGILFYVIIAVLLDRGQLWRNERHPKRIPPVPAMLW
jgi:hypothetical protein